MEMNLMALSKVLRDIADEVQCNILPDPEKLLDLLKQGDELIRGEN